jgi:hypothetical protein
MKDLEDQNERLKMQKDILWGLYQEHRTHARHNETLRSAVNNMLIVASAVLVTLTTSDKEINERDLPGALLLIGFGILGFIFSASYTEKVGRHKTTANQYREELNQVIFTKPVGERNLQKIAEDAYAKHKNFLVPFIKTVGNSFTLWSILPLSISLIGIYLTLVIYKKV